MLSRGVWDAVVIGAGPAGAASAYLLARRGWRVALLERSAWPREKPCGGCLSATALAALDQIGLAHVTHDAAPITSSHLHHRSARTSSIACASLPVGRSLAIDRSIFDQRLVQAFVDAGGRFISDASASLLPGDHRDPLRTLRVQIDSEPVTLRSPVVLACDGLAGSSIVNERWAEWTVSPGAYIGVATSLEGDEFPIASGALHMHIGGGGYVGAVRYADGRVHLAAALDATECRAAGGPARLMEAILLACGREVRLATQKLRGTPTLTRARRALGGHRVLAVGDACGYVEPFTGEGIAWALRSAIRASALLENGWNPSTPRRWQDAHRAAVGPKQSLCHAIRFALRRPVLARGAIRLLDRAPRLSTWVTREGTPA